MWIYADYLSVNQDFIAVFSEEIDRQNAQAWKSFIPHADMQNLLVTLVKALERGNAKDIKSLWVHGPYGTGKTYAAFVLKHLLEDDLAQVRSYFAVHGLGADLERRLQALRERGRILTVYRSSTAHIDSNRKLMTELQESVKEAIRANGLTATVTPTLFDNVLQKLSSPDSSFDWQRAFGKYRQEFPAFTSAVEVYQALQASRPTGRIERQSWRDSGARLMETVCRVMEREGFVTLDDPKSVKNWLKEIIEVNHLAGVVFIWDEFTDFFRKNESTSGLQELAHATAEFPFYLLLVMHRSPDVLPGHADEDRRRLLERFHVLHYQMEPVTAYHLMRDAIKIKEESRELWESFRSNMWDRVQPLAKRLTNTNERPDDFEQLVPLHPYAAFLVSTISRQFSSSQRTLFRFLKESQEGAFITFLSQYPKQEWLWYTADNLWDYFFSDSAGELAERVRDVVSYYGTRCDAIGSEEEKRVFKAVLLFIALNREMVVEERVRPTLENLRHLFRSTPLVDKLNDIVRQLTDRELVRALPIGLGGNEEYTIPLVSADPRVIQDLKKGVRDFRSEAQTGGAIGLELKALFPNDASVARRRQVLTIVSAQEFLQRRDRVAPSVQPYQIGVVCIIGLQEDELVQAERLAGELAPGGDRVMYVVFQTPFGQSRWDKLVNDRAHALYYDKRQDNQNQRFHEQQAKAKISDWVDQARRGSFRVLFAKQVENVSGVDGYDAIFEQVVEIWFPYRQELLSNLATLYTGSYGAAGARIGLGAAATQTRQHQDLVQKLKQDGFWESDPERLAAARNAHPDHPLSHMCELVETAFADVSGTSLDILWQRLQEPPLGLLPSPLGILLFGLLLRPYCQGFYWTDGVNYFPLNADKMAELINGVMHGSQSATIHRQTPEAGEFCTLVRNVFGLPEVRTEYPERAREALREYLQRAGYPIWALQYIPPLQELKRFASVDELAHVLSATEPDAITLSNDLLSSIVPLLKADENTLRQLVTERKPPEEGLRAFFRQGEPTLLLAATKLGLQISDIVRRLRDDMNEEVWLWQEQQVRDRLPGIAAELDLVISLNELLGRNDQNLSSSIQSLNQRLQDCKLPPPVLMASADQAIASTFSSLIGICGANGSHTKDREVAHSIVEAKELIRAHLADPVSALSRWASLSVEVPLSLDEAQQVWDGLDEDSFGWGEDKFRRVVQDKLSTLARRKLAEEVRARWQELTGCSTPEDWSKRHRVPVQWVLTGANDSQLIATLSRLDNASERSLQEALDTMGQNATMLQLVSEARESGRRFIQFVAGEYAGLLSDEQIDQVRSYCLEKAGGLVMEWNKETIHSLACNWLTAAYNRAIRPRVKDRIEHMAEGAMRRLLEELAEDPLVGTIVLKWVEAK